MKQLTLISAFAFILLLAGCNVQDPNVGYDMKVEVTAELDSADVSIARNSTLQSELTTVPLPHYAYISVVPGDEIWVTVSKDNLTVTGSIIRRSVEPKEVKDLGNTLRYIYEVPLIEL